jgi:hypothetical protein
MNEKTRINGGKRLMAESELFLVDKLGLPLAFKVTG